MYFFRYHSLKEKLKSRTLTDREALPYLVLFSGIASAVYLIPPVEELNVWDWIGGGMSVVLAIAGVIYTYAQNGGKQGQDLIQKFVVIGWVVGVRCVLIFIPCWFALYSVGDVLGLMSDESSWYDTLVFFGFKVIYYQRLGKHIHDTK